MRTLATAAESYSIDNNQYPVSGDLKSLAELLEPTYVRTIPERDAWGEPFLYIGGPSDYCIVSLAAGGQPDVAGHRDVKALAKGSGASHDKTRDIIFCGGSFVSWYE